MTVQKNPEGSCVKCNDSKFEDRIYCRDCLVARFHRKLKSTLFKSHGKQKDARVLIAISNGSSSLALLNALCTIYPRCGQYILGHVDMTILGEDPLDCGIWNSTQLACMVEPLESAFGSGESNKEQLTRLAENCPKSAYKDAMDMLKLNVLTTMAKTHGCTTIYFGDTMTKTAVRLFSLITKGQGHTIPSELGPCTLHMGLAIVRPLKEHSAKEVETYIRARELKPVPKIAIDDPFSVDNLAERFITQLETNFPSTSSTVYRTCLKVETRDTTKTCELCTMPIQQNESIFCKRCSYFGLAIGMFPDRG